VDKILHELNKEERLSELKKLRHMLGAEK